MDTPENVGGRDRLIRAVLAVGLTGVAIGAFLSGKRKTSLLAGSGALGFGVTATTQYCGLNARLERDTTRTDVTTDPLAETTAGDTADDTDRESATDLRGRRSRPSVSLSCAHCGDPIRLGESRGPNDDNEIIHTTCAEAVESA